MFDYIARLQNQLIQTNGYLLSLVKVNGYACIFFSAVLMKGNNFYDFLFASQDDRTCFKKGSALKGEQILSCKR